ncbi:MAG: ABC transporter permease [Anaerolineales bacterium]|nr:ABC transporter permease [Anaerolineales bacterium]
MTRFVIRRILGLLFVLFGVTIMTFALAQLVPADPVAAALGSNARDDQIEAYRKQLGLDQPAPVRYVIYMKNLLQGDLGASIRTRRPVMDDLIDYLPATIELSLAAMTIALLVGVPIGVFSALHRNSWVDVVARISAMAFGSMPIFYIGLLALGFFWRQLQWLPGPGRLDATMQPPQRITGLFTFDAAVTGNWPVFWNASAHLILPGLILALFSTAVLLRMTRSSMLEILGQDYIRTARAKGLNERNVLYRHAFKNALPPILTTTGIVFGSLLSGAVLTETIFNWPGLGRYATTSVTTLDYPAVLGVTLVAATIYPLVNTLIDISYTAVDPRVRID